MCSVVGSDLSKDIEELVVEEIKASLMFSLQMDESTDVACLSELVRFAEYV